MCVSVCVCMCVCVCVCVVVVSVIVKCPMLPPCAVDGHSRNPFYYFCYFSHLECEMIRALALLSDSGNTASAS